MKNIKFKKVSIRDLDQIRTLYWRLLDSSPEYGRILQWKKNMWIRQYKRDISCFFPGYFGWMRDG